MKRTILLDLDGTLLENKMDRFLPAYFERLGRHLAHIAPPESMLNELLAGTRSMLENLDPRFTLEQVFSKHFFPALGLDEAQARPQIEAFYREQFPGLKALTRPIAGAVELVHELLGKGYELVVATNPLFPRMALEERLRWAGLSPDNVNFTRITSYENSHFAKPNPEYFAEILARLGRSPDQAIMVGDDLERDIHPAAALGLAVYYTGSQPSAVDGERPAAGADGGTHEDPASALGLGVRYSADKTAPCIMNGPLKDLPAALTDGMAGAQLSTAPPHILLARLRAALAATLGSCLALDGEAWDARPQTEEWALVEILAHLRDVEREVNLPRLELILNEDNPHLPAYDTDRWAEERHYRSLHGPRVLDEFTEARMRTVTRLASLGTAAWARPARHTLLGPTTLHELMKIVTEHDWLHMAQIRKTLEQVAPLHAA